MNKLIAIVSIVFAAVSLSAQPFSMKLNLRSDNTITLVLSNDGPADYNYTQVQDINALVSTGGNLLTGIASSDYDLVLNPGGYLNLGSAFNSGGSISANSEVVLGVINLVPGPHQASDFAISDESFPPVNRASWGTDTSLEFPNVQATLPITITSITATKLSETSARIDWSTSMEVNSSHFVVQRSADLTNWVSLGSVEAAGESREVLEYSFLDTTIPRTLRAGDGTFYYRLVAVDLDDAFEISEVRSLTFDVASTAINVYPNPTSELVVIDLAQVEGDAQITMMDIQGRVVYNLLATNEHNNMPVINLREQGFEAGTYIIRIVEKETEKVHTRKLLLLD